jgi:hypothetical protein
MANLSPEYHSTQILYKKSKRQQLFQPICKMAAMVARDQISDVQISINICNILKYISTRLIWCFYHKVHNSFFEKKIAVLPHYNEFRQRSDLLVQACWLTYVLNVFIDNIQNQQRKNTSLQVLQPAVSSHLLTSVTLLCLNGYLFFIPMIFQSYKIVTIGVEGL